MDRPLLILATVVSICFEHDSSAAPTWDETLTVVYEGGCCQSGKSQFPRMVESDWHLECSLLKFRHAWPDIQLATESQ